MVQFPFFGNKATTTLFMHKMLAFNLVLLVKFNFIKKNLNNIYVYIYMKISITQF